METADAGGFTGYASVFGNFDSAKEAVVKGAFQNCLQDFVKNGFVALNHDWSINPIGYVAKAVEDEKGLLVDVKFHSTPAAQEVRTVMQERAAAGKSTKMSIGYKVLKSEPTVEGRLLKELKLYEVSVVGVGANEQTSIVSVKSEGEQYDTEQHNKQQNADMVKILVKAMLLGENTERGMLMAGMENLCRRLEWKIWETLGNEMLTNSDKITLCQAMLMEFADVGMQAVEAFLREPNAVQTASAKALEVKTGRVLSAANHAAVKSWAASLKGVAGEMESLLSETEPEKSIEPEAQKTDDDTAAKAAKVNMMLMGIQI